MNVKRSLCTSAAVLVLVAGACSTPSPSEQAQGTYVYKRGNGTADVTLLPENRFRMSVILGKGTRHLEGSYALQSDTIVLTNTAGNELRGLANDTALLLYMGGEDLVPFRKQ